MSVRVQTAVLAPPCDFVIFPQAGYLGGVACYRRIVIWDFWLVRSRGVTKWISWCWCTLSPATACHRFARWASHLPCDRCDSYKPLRHTYGVYFSQGYAAQAIGQLTMSSGHAWGSGQNERERYTKIINTDKSCLRDVFGKTTLYATGPSTGLKLTPNVHEGLNHTEVIACAVLLSVLGSFMLGTACCARTSVSFLSD